MEYDIKAKRTLYDGIWFRSRLEAKWAVMFNLLGWQWGYEPFDLGGWSPDFILRGTYNNILVEVKPEGFIDEQLIHKVGSAWEAAYKPMFTPEGYVDLHAKKVPLVLLVDAVTPVLCPDWEAAFLGMEISWKIDHGYITDKMIFKEAQKTYGGNPGWDYGSGELAWDGRLFNDMSARKRFLEHPSDMMLLWNDATNIVQFQVYNDII